MTKAMFLAACVFTGGAYAASITPVSHARAMPKGGKVIIDQTAGSTGAGLLSQNFGSGYKTYEQVAADAFKIRNGAKVTAVVADGQYFNGSGPAASETVTFYKNGKGSPGKAIKSCTYTNVDGTDSNGAFTITLPKACTLQKGTYWVSVVANLTFRTGSEWGWLDATETGPYQAEYEDPYGTGSCTTWCKAGSGLKYQLIGSGS
jgi:hypothetical protein